MTTRRQSEMGVVTKAKDLCKYIMVVTQKSPKQYRFTFTTRMQNLSMNVIEYLYRANDTFVTKGPSRAERYKQRLDFQHKAMTELRLLAYFAQLAEEQKAILPKQYALIAKEANESMNMLGAWMISDKRRFEKE